MIKECKNVMVNLLRHLCASMDVIKIVMHNVKSV